MGVKPRSTHVGLSATALELGPGFRHSCSYGYSGGAGSPDTQSGSHSDFRADNDQSISRPGIWNVSSLHVAPNIVLKGASFVFTFLATLPQALTLALATSIPGVGIASDGFIEDTTEAKSAALGSLPSRCLTFARVKQAPQRLRSGGLLLYIAL